MGTKIIQIENTDIILQDYGHGKGKIIISDTDWGYDFSFYWGAMGKDTTLAEFICHINWQYFVDKLSKRRKGDFDSKGTFRNIRKYIREEISHELPWYKHMEFQKNMREELNIWQNECDSESTFINSWVYFFEHRLNYDLIEDEYDRKEIESHFKSIQEYWNFIEYEIPRENIWLKHLHRKLKKHLQQTYQLAS